MSETNKKELSEDENIDYTLVINELRKMQFHVELVLQNDELKHEIQYRKKEQYLLQKKYDAFVESHNISVCTINEIQTQMMLTIAKKDCLIAELQTQLTKKEIKQ